MVELWVQGGEEGREGASGDAKTEKGEGKDLIAERRWGG